MQALEVHNLSKAFGSFKAVDNLSFTIPEGVVFGLLGRNGAGKTTTIRMLMNIYEPDSGEIRFRGARVGQQFRDKVGYLPEERGLNTRLRVLDTLLYLAELKGATGPKVKEKAMHYLERFELADRAKNKVQELSKGNQQKIQFISTILHEPDFIILDEPFSGLDPVNTNLFKDIILELKQQGRAIIFSTHLMDFAEKMCDRIALVDHGKLLLSGALAEVKKRFSSRNVILHYDGNIGFLQHRPYVVKVQDFGNYSGVEVRDRDDIQQLLSDLVYAGVKIRKFDANDISLHEIFLSQTGPASKATPTTTTASINTETTGASA
ncbi:MAG: ATP-binding cassette domain-containing protein [Pseudomonadota bacterium]